MKTARLAPAITLAIALIAAPALALAQTAPSTSEDARNTPAVAAANQDVAAQIAVQQDAVGDVNADAQAQYAQDMGAYREAVQARHHVIASDARVYDHQQRAYADAMADWRRQVYACKHGSNRACDAPTPDPAHYW